MINTLLVTEDQITEILLKAAWQVFLYNIETIQKVCTGMFV